MLTCETRIGQWLSVNGMSKATPGSPGTTVSRLQSLLISFVQAWHLLSSFFLFCWLTVDRKEIASTVNQQKERKTDEVAGRRTKKLCRRVFILLVYYRQSSADKGQGISRLTIDDQDYKGHKGSSCHDFFQSWVLFVFDLSCPVYRRLFPFV